MKVCGECIHWRASFLGLAPLEEFPSPGTCAAVPPKCFARVQRSPMSNAANAEGCPCYTTAAEQATDDLFAIPRKVD